MCLYTVKKDWVKNTKNGDGMTRFWYTLKNLHPKKDFKLSQYVKVCPYSTQIN
jgi:hypothetical protein